jgi:hypothetical protein
MPGFSNVLHQTGMFPGQATEHEECSSNIVPGEKIQQGFGAVFHPVFKIVPAFNVNT